MKPTMDYVFLTVIFMLIILGSLMSSCCTVLPFSRELVPNYSSVEGLVNMTPVSNASTYSNKIDIFGEAKSTKTCPQNGYSSADGFVCFTPEQLKLLTTRGGNSSTQ
jgi:hypothetical protein